MEDQVNKFLLSAAVIFFMACASFAVDIVKDGKATAEIVIPKDANPIVRTAATEFQDIIAKMSGAKLDIVNEPSGKVKSKVWFGENEMTKKLGLDLKDVKYDGYKIIVKGDDIIAAGVDIEWYKYYGFCDDNLYKVADKWLKHTGGHKWRSPMFMYSLRETCREKDESKRLEFNCGIDATGTIFAAYALLEQLGFRWYMPFADIGQVIPEKKDIAVADQNIKSEPAFRYRNWSHYRGGRDEAMWFKSMGGGISEFIFSYHAAGRILDGEEDPECAGKVNGKTDFHAPKLSGEKFRSTFLQYLECVNTFYPKMLPYVSFNQPDGWSTMDDEDIANGWDKLKERGNEGRYSDYAWDFNMNMLERYNKKYPGNKQRKAFYAYSGTVGVPSQLKDKFIPDDMTCVFTNTTAYDHLNPQFTGIMKEWFKCVKEPEQFIYYDYLYDRGPHRNYPPTPYIFTENLKQLFKNVTPDKCLGFLIEYDSPFGGAGKDENRNTNIGCPAETHLMMYLYSKLMWDPKLDVDKLLAEYYTLYYGPASEEMKALDKFGEEIWMRKAPRRVTASGGNIKEEDVTKLFDILGRARAKVEADSIYAKRLDRLAYEMEPLKKLFANLQRKGPTIQAGRIGENIKCDGDLSKDFWKNVPFYPLKDMHTGVKPGIASSSAAFRCTPTALYIAIECREPKMDALHSRTKTRDDSGIWADDFLELRLETPNGRMPVINVNPEGAIFDQDATDPNVANLPEFYSVSDYAVNKYADKWCIEIRIDYASLGALIPNRSAPWGIQISHQRLAGDKPEFYQLSPTGQAFNKGFEMMGNITTNKQ
jgi:hypothetical protein